MNNYIRIITLTGLKQTKKVRYKYYDEHSAQRTY